MKITSILFDQKIMGINVAVEMSIAEYFSFATEILEKNAYQRSKVKTAGKIYDLLRHDMVRGCVIPPVVLAVGNHFNDQVERIVSQLDANQDTSRVEGEIRDVLSQAISRSDLLILDGLQRTLTMSSIINSRSSEFPPEEISNFMKRVYRFEIYLGLSKPGILYRMLTLNTGQTPMSFRHQLEILYNDYIDRSDLPDGISIFRESDEKRARGAGKFKYSDVVDMFYAFSTASPMPYNRQALVAELKEMDFLESYSFKPGTDVMSDLLVLFNKIVEKIDELSNSWVLDKADVEQVDRPFGTTAQTLLARPQCMTGFGAECKRLIDNGTFESLADISEVIDKLTFSNDPGTSLTELVMILDQIAKSAKKIGDAQRYYFQYAIRHLLTPGTENSFDLSRCWLKGQESYKMMYE
ncbi:hypothetical protein ACUXV3_15745 [Roseobacteraceae bacterium NS-SX3]